MNLVCESLMSRQHTRLSFCLTPVLAASLCSLQSFSFGSVSHESSVVSSYGIHVNSVTSMLEFSL